jgi:hypothetical protein
MTNAHHHPDLTDDHVLFRMLTLAVSTEHSTGLHDDHDVPPDALALANLAPQLAAIDGELAELVFDSNAEDTLVLRDARGNGRSLTYASGSVNLDLDVHADGRTIIGIVEPARWSTAIVETPTGSHEVRVDEFGRFRFVGAEHLVRFRLAGEAGRLLTPWLRR